MIMSTGKRLAKRSIIGTRVAALGDDGLYYSGMIQAVKTPAPFPENNNCINLTPNTRYTVRFDGGKNTREYRDAELIGPGFRGMQGVKLQPTQRVFLTYNGREVRADVISHDHQTDDLQVQVHAPAAEVSTGYRFILLSSRQDIHEQTDKATNSDAITTKKKPARRKVFFASHFIFIQKTSTRSFFYPKNVCKRSVIISAYNLGNFF